MNGEPPYKNTFLVFGTACAAVLSLSVLVAYLNQSGSLIDLDGTIGRMDHPDMWNNLDILSSLLYSTGDYCCHQETARSLVLNGNQMPMCIRETFLFLGMAAGFLILSSGSYLPVKERFLLCTFLILLTPLEWYAAHYLGFDSPVLRAIVSLISGAGFAGFLSAILEKEYEYLGRKSVKFD